MECVDRLRVPRWNDLAVRMVTEGEEHGPLYLATPAGTKLDDVATETYHGSPDDLARLGFAVAHALSPDAPKPANLSDEVQALAKRIANALMGAEKPLVVSGTSCGSGPVIHAAANVAWALNRNGVNGKISFVVPECNSLGVGLLDKRGLNEAFDQVREGKADTVVIVENDLYRHADEAAVNNFLESATSVIAMDHVPTGCTSAADVVLPSGTFADCTGTLVNNEGRAQRFFRVIGPQGHIQESWKWIQDIMNAADRCEGPVWSCVDDLLTDLAETLPDLADVAKAAVPATFRAEGMKVPRQSLRFSGRTGMHANVTMHEPKPPVDKDSSLAFSMEGYRGIPPSSLISRYWAPGWNSVQALNKFQEEIGGPLKGGDPGKRLIEPKNGKTVTYFSTIPDAFQPRENEWLIVALHHLFGSEELSSLAPGIAERSPDPYLAFNPDDADRLGVTNGKKVELALQETSISLRVLVIPTMPKGIAGFPCGFAGIKRPELPSWGTVTPK